MHQLALVGQSSTLLAFLVEMERTPPVFFSELGLGSLDLILSCHALQSRSLYGRHVSTSFLDPVFGAIMKQTCRQTLKSLAAECLVGVLLGLLNFLTPVCVD